MKIGRIFYIVIFPIIIAFMAIPGFVKAEQALPAPTILNVGVKETPSKSILVTGVTFNNTEVDVYIDNEFFGSATVKNGPSGVASFAYELSDGFSFGEHNVYTIARSVAEDKVSEPSELDYFYFQRPTPAPILLEPVVDEMGKLAIVGLAKNDLRVLIYIEGVLQVDFVPPTAKSGVTNFWYKPNLPAGEYTVSAKTVDASGKESAFSSNITLFVPRKTEVAEVDGQEKIEESTSSQQVELEEAPDKADEIISQDPIKQSDQFEDENAASLEEKISDQPEVIDSKKDETKIIIESDEKSSGVVTIEEPEEIGEIVLDTNEDQLAVLPEDVADEVGREDAIVFGDEKNEDIAQGAFEELGDGETVDQIQQRNRMVGFVILLIIALVLAVWYVKEKKQAEDLENTDSKPDDKKSDNNQKNSK